MGYLHGNSDRIQNTPEQDMAGVLGKYGFQFNVEAITALAPTWRELKAWKQDLIIQFLKVDRFQDVMTIIGAFPNNSIMPRHKMFNGLENLEAQYAIAIMSDAIEAEAKAEAEESDRQDRQNALQLEAFNKLTHDQKVSAVNLIKWSKDNWEHPSGNLDYLDFCFSVAITKEETESALSHADHEFYNYYNPMTGEVVV